MTEVESTIRQFIVKEIMLGDDESVLALDHPLLKAGTIDSMDLGHLVSFLEEELGITVDDKELKRDNFENIHAVAKLVERLQAAG